MQAIPIYKSKIPKLSRKIINDCFHCGGKITSKTARAKTKYCSTKCRGLSQRKIKTINCLYCGKEFQQNNKYQKFCSSNCSGSNSNKNRPPPSEETKLKMSEIMKRKYANGEIKHYTTFRKYNKKLYCDFEYKNCIICDNIFIASSRKKNKENKTCGEECRVIAININRTYINGTKKITKYFNPYQNKEVTLDSSWEVKVADFLCDNDIEWTRPPHINWFDMTGKKRMYFPDFYLPDHNLYLDPKNPYCMKQDKEKLYVISKMINIVYGDVDYVIENIEELVRMV